MYMKKKKKKKKKATQTKFWKRARAICNLHVCYIFVRVLHHVTWEFTRFYPSESRNFVM